MDRHLTFHSVGCSHSDQISTPGALHSTNCSVPPSGAQRMCHNRWPSESFCEAQNLAHKRVTLFALAVRPIVAGQQQQRCAPLCVRGRCAHCEITLLAVCGTELITALTLPHSAIVSTDQPAWSTHTCVLPQKGSSPLVCSPVPLSLSH